MKLSFKNVVQPALILCSICFVVSALLALTNALTIDVIAKATLEKEETARMLVLSDATSFEASADETYYIGYCDGEIVGYVFSTEANGYGGAISVMTGISTNSTITGVTIVSHDETPGLGSNAEKTEFTDQYQQNSTEFSVVKNTEAGDGEIEALTGATITSKAVTTAVNIATELYETIKEGE